jgi:hypothetical protein
MSSVAVGLVWMAYLVLLSVVWCLCAAGIHGTLLLFDFLNPLLTALLVRFLNGTFARSRPRSSILTALFRLYHNECSEERSEKKYISPHRAGGGEGFIAAQGRWRIDGRGSICVWGCYTDFTSRHGRSEGWSAICSASLGWTVVSPCILGWSEGSPGVLVTDTSGELSYFSYSKTENHKKNSLLLVRLLFLLFLL